MSQNQRSRRPLQTVSPPPPPVDLKAVVQKARVLREELTAATERLNQLIGECENALAGLDLGVEAEVLLPFHKAQWEQALVFSKENGVWRLIVETGPVGGEVEVVPLVRCSRAVRLRAIDYLPSLLTALLGTVEKLKERVEESHKTAHSFLQTTEALKKEL